MAIHTTFVRETIYIDPSSATPLYEHTFRAAVAYYIGYKEIGDKIKAEVIQASNAWYTKAQKYASDNSYEDFIGNGKSVRVQGFDVNEALYLYRQALPRFKISDLCSAIHYITTKYNVPVPPGFSYRELQEKKAEELRQKQLEEEKKQRRKELIRKYEEYLSNNYPIFVKRLKNTKTDAPAENWNNGSLIVAAIGIGLFILAANLPNEFEYIWSFLILILAGLTIIVAIGLFRHGLKIEPQIINENNEHIHSFAESEELTNEEEYLKEILSWEILYKN